MPESSKPKTQKCHSAFETLKNTYNDIVAEYSKLPATLKAKGVKRVKFTSEDKDMDKTDFKSSKSVCKFASTYVSKLKRAETNHKTRFAEARKLLCNKGGALLKQRMFSKLSNCLRRATRYATGDAKRHALTDAHNFDEVTRMYVQGLLSLMKEKCAMKKKFGSKFASVTNIFQETLQTQIKKVAGLLTAKDRNQIAKLVNEAVKKQHPKATDIATIIKDSLRRQLRARRALASSVNVVATWYETEPPTVSDSVELTQVLGADYESSPAEMTLESTDASFQSPEPIDSIDDQLPVIPEIDISNQDSNVTTKAEDEINEVMTESSPGADKQMRAVASAVRGQTVFGIITAMCVALLMTSI